MNQSIFIGLIISNGYYSSRFNSFYRCMARNALHVNRDLFLSMAWTAHGTKIWDRPGSLSYVLTDDSPVPAMPELEEIFRDADLSLVVGKLARISIDYYDSSVFVERDVRRLPLKVRSENANELNHQLKSYDGLGAFYPYDIYPSNIASRIGLLEALERVQRIDGFGLIDSPRSGKYSILLVDVAIFWQLLRIFYTFTGLAPIRHDLFLCLGFWHTYQHAHKLVWSEFRSTFLADSFFVLFPNDSLLFAPKLLQSSTFFTYLLLSYRHWKANLISAIQRVKHLLLVEEMVFVNEIDEKKSKDIIFR